MTQVKLLELRDAGTFIPLLCVDVSSANNEAQRYLLRRCGYPLNGNPNVIVTMLDANGRPATNDPYQWPGPARTLSVAHHWIIEHWFELHDGDVVDVEYILGETSTCKVSERTTIRD
jgi:hypothetical protein